MDTKDKLTNLVLYLNSIKNLNTKVIRNISKYEKIFWQKKLLAQGGIIKTGKNKKERIEITEHNKHLYNNFLKLYLKLKNNKEDFEIVVGHYILCWKIDNIDIVHPLFTVKLELNFDKKTNTFILKPVNNKFNMEVNILDNIPIDLNLRQIVNIKRKISTGDIDIKDTNKIKGILKKVVKFLSPRGEVVTNIDIDPKDFKAIKYPIIYDESVIIVRKVNNRVWDQEFKGMLNKIQEEDFIPPTIKALVDENYGDKCKHDMGRLDNDWREIQNNLLFPLPYNKNQEEVARSLSKKFGVVVQGPPGTGKSHTISNLVCHLLANDKKVLVTSQSNKPFNVILNKIPDEIKPLCVNTIDFDYKSLNVIKNSANKIVEGLRLDAKSLSSDIEYLNKKLILCKRRQKFLCEKLKGKGFGNNEYIRYYGKHYSLCKVEEWVQKNQDKYSWIEDEINDWERPPITDAKFSRLIYLMSNVTKEDIRQFNESGSLIYGVPSCDEITSRMEKLLDIKKNYIIYRQAIKNWYVSYNSNYKYEYILRLLDNAERFLEGIENTWFENIFISSLKGETTKVVLQQTILKCNYYIKKIGSIRKKISGHSVNVPEDVDVFELSEIFDTVYKQYKQKGKLNKLFKFIHSDWEKLIKSSFVDFKPLDSKEQVKLAKLYIDGCCTEKKLKELWNGTMKEYGCEDIDTINLRTLTCLEDYIEKIDLIINWHKRVVSNIVDAMKKVVFLEDVDWYKKSTYCYIKKGILAIKAISEYENLRIYISYVEKLISNVPGLEKIVQAIKQQDIKKIKRSYEKVIRLKEIGPYIVELNSLLEKIRKYCPKLVDKLINEKDKLNMLVKYKGFSLAWTWRQLKCILDKETNKYRLDEINRKLEEEKNNELKLVKLLVCKKSWYNQIVSIKESDRRSLCSLIEAIKRVGKGTSKHYSNYMRLVHKEMRKFKNIVPVWIMPINKVIENFPLCSYVFDVVIIDEASQSDIFAISALFRGKKSVIVGDDKQISPEGIGYDFNKVSRLINIYLKDIPHAQWFDMKTSIYSTALRVFPDRIVFREHFRSVPEIIQFSNKICGYNQVFSKKNYNNKYILGSPIKTIKVDGFRDVIRPVNIKEANALVDKIVQCCRSPKYDNMTMGVMSLLGNYQCDIIKRLLTKKLGEDEIKRRKLICGNIYSFQGQERDIMFLSMVIANNVKYTALTKEADIRRFNMAVSRAKSQIWVFYSVNVKDLNPECIRAKLLNYCINVEKTNNKGVDFKSHLKGDVYKFVKPKDYYKVKPYKIIDNYKANMEIS